MEIKSLSMSERLRMLQQIDPVKPIIPKTSQGIDDSDDGKQTFGDFLKTSIANVNQTSLEAEAKLEKTIRGKEPYAHTTILALQKADISFQLLMTVQRKITEAYREILRTPIG